MICRRRLCRNQLMLFLFIILIGVWFFMKSFVFVLKHDNVKTDQIVDGRSREDNKIETENEINRLSQMNNKELANDFEREHQELMKKYNESLREQREDEDAFHEKHLVESKYTDFTNFKIDFNETSYLPEHLLSVIDKLNKNPTVHNREKLKNLPKEYAVIIVQVHKRIEYFKELLDSLQRSKGIEESLLIISHDFYCDEMNALVRIIKFCPVSFLYIIKSL